MKNGKLTLLLTGIILISFRISYSQNPVWSFPPKYFDFLSFNIYSFPTPGAPGGNGTPGVDYSGQPAAYCHNAMSDANGNLLFFIVDGVIYDKDGYYIDKLSASINQSDTVKGTAEICVVPNPANCKQFYLFLASNGGNNNNQFSQPYYALLDLSLPNNNANTNTPRFGALVPDNYGQTLTNILQKFNISIPAKARFRFAATKLTPNNTRLVFIQDGSRIITLEIGNNTVSLLNNISNVFSSFDPNITGETDFSRSELEVFESRNNTYLLAFPFNAQYSNVVSPGYGVAYLEIDNTGNIIPGSENIITYPTNALGGTLIQGLEFSPNGQYIYLTHLTNSQNPIAIEYIDINTGISTPLNVTNHQDFEKSMIELATDGKLYLATANRLASIGNPNTPSNITWSNNSISINYYLTKDEIAYSQSGVYISYSYLLPDQIDGMDYSAFTTVNTECCLFYSTSSFDIQDYTATTTAQTWQPGSNPFGSSGTVKVADKIVIPAGATVTIKNMTFEFTPDAYVEVQKGGRLILDNSVFTHYTDCGNDVLWTGVYVAGTPNALQAIPANRGWFEMRNNSRVEYAYTGVRNYNRTASGGIDWSQIGGVIRSNNSAFKNNIRDVEFLAFSNLHPNGTRLNDISRFTKTRFITDAGLANINKIPGYHVTIWNVKGIVFSGCTFENQAPAQYAYWNRGNGIESIDAVYTVTRYCNTFNCNNAVNSAFRNLYMGIRSYAGTNGYTVNINNTGFDNNWRSIYLRGMQYPAVVNNTFDIGENRYNSVSPPNVSYGLYLHNSTGYKVENNEFNSTHNGYVGVYVNNSGTAANKIYRNRFYNLTIGSQTFKTNGDYSAANWQQGLEFQCNNYYDIQDYDILMTNGSIKNMQGLCSNDPTSPANNLFSYTAQNSSFWVDNTINNYVTYTYANNPAFNLIPQYINNIKSATSDCSVPPANTSPYDPQVSCPDKSPNGGIININLRQAQYNQLKQTVDSLLAIIDGGNTKALLQTVQDNTVPAWQKRNQLIAVSPYVSDAVLQALIQSYPATPAWVISQVLAENAPLTDNVLATLINTSPQLPDYVVRNVLQDAYPLSNQTIATLLKSNNQYAAWVIQQVLTQNTPLSNQNLLLLMEKSLPNYVIRNIMQANSPLSADVYDALLNHTPSYPRWVVRSADGLPVIEEHYVYQQPNYSPRSLLDLEIAHLKAEMDFAKNDIIRACLFDTTGVYSEKDAVLFLEQQKCSRKEWCSITGLCIAAQDYTKASQYIDTLAADTNTAQLANYYTTVVNVKQQPQAEALVATDSTTKATFTAYTTTQGHQAVLAQSVVEFMTNQPITEEVAIITPSSNARMSGTDNHNENEETTLSTPTLTTDVNANIDIYPNPVSQILYIYTDFSQAQVTLYDISGKEVLNGSISSTNAKIDVSQLENGVYMLTIYNKGQLVKTDRIVINR